MDINEKKENGSLAPEEEKEEGAVVPEEESSGTEEVSEPAEDVSEEEEVVSEAASEEPEEDDDDPGIPDYEPSLSFEYNVTNAEEEEAFLTFQKRYVYKHNWRVTAAFGAVALIFLISVFRNPSGYLNWVLMFICLFMIFVTWFNTVRIRKYLVSALKALEDDKYRFTLYDDRFIIETVFTEEEMAEEDFIPVKPRIVLFKDIGLNVIEKSNMFILILKKETIYVLSKRVLSEDQQRTLRSCFSEMLGEDYVSET